MAIGVDERINSSTAAVRAPGWQGATSDLYHWVAVHYGSYEEPQQLDPPRAFDTGPLTHLMRNVDHPFDNATIEAYLEDMQRVGVVEADVATSGLWVVMRGVVDGKEASDDPYLTLTLSGGAVQQVATAPLVYDSEVRLLCPQEYLLGSAGAESSTCLSMMYCPAVRSRQQAHDRSSPIMPYGIIGVLCCTDYYCWEATKIRH
jgi:hypothetical protein